ncbi:unnamed protein product [Rhodiola kirilowii]
MASSGYVVEITIISCEDLTTTSFKKPIRKNARGVIRMPHCNEQVCSTSLDKEGGSFPRWNEKFTMEMSSWANWFDVEIYSGMEKVIGKARIPASDFVGGILPEGYLNFLSYRLREKNGEWNGIVNVSVRVIKRKKEREEGFGCGYVVGVPSRMVTGIPVYSGVKM